MTKTTTIREENQSYVQDLSRHATAYIKMLQEMQVLQKRLNELMDSVEQPVTKRTVIGVNFIPLEMYYIQSALSHSIQYFEQNLQMLKHYEKPEIVS